MNEHVPASGDHDDHRADQPGATPASVGLTLLSVPEVAAALGIRDREVRGLIADRVLIGIRRGGAGPRVPADLLVEGERPGERVVVPGLRGTIMQLSDAGFTDEEILGWLLRHNAELGSTPLAALIDLRTHAVRRAAQALAF